MSGHLFIKIYVVYNKFLLPTLGKSFALEAFLYVCTLDTVLKSNLFLKIKSKKGTPYSNDTQNFKKNIADADTFNNNF